MKKMILVSILSLGLPAGAAVRDLGQGAVDLTNALVHCGQPLLDAAKEARVSEATYAEPIEVAKNITEEAWHVRFVKGGYVNGPPARTVATFSIVRRVDSSGPFVPDRPSRVSYQCTVKFGRSNEEWTVLE